MAKKQGLGFGFIPEETEHHFLVIIPKGNGDNTKISVYERFTWQQEVAKQTVDLVENRCKAVMSKYKWQKIETAVKDEFNRRLNKDNILVGNWKTGQVPVARLFGKELILLIWAIEDCDPSVIPNAIRNWLGLSPEERWWLFTMSNAVTGQANDKRGWRKAVRYALTENPVDELVGQGNIIEMLYRNEKVLP
ncbi:MAG: hypothetical protein ACI8WT_001570 [Clostridium sp.]|jgi:hypothetical protein